MEIKLLQERLSIAKKTLDICSLELLEDLQCVPAEITLIELDAQSEMVLELREIKALLKESLTKINKVLDPAERHLCQTIANETEDGLTYNHARATITASARGFFSIIEPTLFYRWIKAQKYQEPEEVFVNLVNSKKARAELCEELFQDGKNLPPGIKEHIIASVIVRRKSDG